MVLYIYLYMISVEPFCTWPDRGRRQMTPTTLAAPTYTPVHFVDGVSVDAVAARPSKRRRSKQGRVHLDEREKKQEGPRWIPGEKKKQPVFSSVIKK